MPPLARNLVDSNAVAAMTGWINSLPGTPAEAPPTILPAGGSFTGSVSITLQPPDTNAVLYYTLDGSLPTTNSFLYTGPFAIGSDTLLSANAFETGYINSVAATARFTIVTNMLFSAPGFVSGAFQVRFTAPTGFTYVLQASTNLASWIPLSTSVPASSPFYWVDPGASNFPTRFYRVVQLP
jgi:hypothetical protein